MFPCHPLLVALGSEPGNALTLLSRGGLWGLAACVMGVRASPWALFPVPSPVYVPTSVPPHPSDCPQPCLKLSPIPLFVLPHPHPLPISVPTPCPRLHYWSPVPVLFPSLSLTPSLLPYPVLTLFSNLSHRAPHPVPPLAAHGRRGGAGRSLSGWARLGRGGAFTGGGPQAAVRGATGL